MTKRAKANKGVYRKLRGLKDSDISAALTNHQEVLKQMIGAHQVIDQRLAAIEDFVRQLVAANLPEEAAVADEPLVKL